MVYELKAHESAYFWHDYACCEESNCLGNPLPELGCEYLLMANLDMGDLNPSSRYHNYYGLVKLDASRLTPPGQLESASLEFYVVEDGSSLTTSLEINRLTQPWWRDCPAEANLWEPVCPDAFPTAIYLDEIYPYWQEFSLDPWMRFNITEIYRSWQTGEFQNFGFGFRLKSLFGGYVLCAGGNYPDPELRPRLVVSTVSEPALKFPLEGKYNESRITGYDFGEWWEQSFCTDGVTPLRHTGVDLHASAEDDVYAIWDGIVRYKAVNAEVGGYVVLEHAGGWTSTYTHVVPSNSIAIDQPVERGKKIGEVARITAPHLHLQVRKTPYPTDNWRQEVIVRRGRLPDGRSCLHTDGITDPAFPEQFIDPKCLDWEK
jgi:hypothetical protein